MLYFRGGGGGGGGGGGLARERYPRDEVRPDLDLPRVVCEFVDFFLMSYLDYLYRG